MCAAMRCKNLLPILFTLLMVSGMAEGAVSKVIRFSGHLGEGALAAAKGQLEEVEKGDVDRLIMEIDSSSGDIEALLQVAKKIYSLKVEKGVKVITYIEESAVGPAALLPFLSDRLYISYLVSWGDIPLGTDGIVPTNLLKSRVTSLIEDDNPKSALLRQVAEAMIDPALTATIEGGKLQLKSKSGIELSSSGETLILNHRELSELKLISRSLSLEAFRKEADIEVKEPEVGKRQEAAIEKSSVVEELKKHINYSKEGKTLIGHIAIDDKKQGINQSTWIYVKSALDYYKELKPSFIILELNTPGGEVYAAQNISDALQAIDAEYNIPVVAFIDNWAISAGAMLAYSCRFITSTEDGSMGAAEPVIMGEGGQMKSASEKVNSALRTDFANRSRFFGRNSDIAEAMVDKDIILVLRHGKILRLESEEQIRLKGPSPDKVITNKGKLLTLNAQQLIDYGVADLTVPPGRGAKELNGAERGEGSRPFSSEGLSKAPFFDEIKNGTVMNYQMDWRTRFFALLAMPIVSTLLIWGVLAGFYIEFNTPGFGLPGTIGVICLLLIVISNLSLEIASWLEVLLMLIGIALIAIELTLLPTGGILGFFGALFFIGGLFAIMLPNIGKVDYEFDTKTLNAAGEEFFRRLAWLSGSLVIGFLLIAALSRFITPSLAGLNRLVLSGNEQEGYIAGQAKEALPEVGRRGIAETTLRPAGKIAIEGELYDAVTAGGFIEKGEEIAVERHDGSVIVVSKLARGV